MALPFFEYEHTYQSGAGDTVIWHSKEEFPDVQVTRTWNGFEMAREMQSGRLIYNSETYVKPDPHPDDRFPRFDYTPDFSDMEEEGDSELAEAFYELGDKSNPQGAEKLIRQLLTVIREAGWVSDTEMRRLQAEKRDLERQIANPPLLPPEPEEDKLPPVDHPAKFLSVYEKVEAMRRQDERAQRMQDDDLRDLMRHKYGIQTHFDI